MPHFDEWWDQPDNRRHRLPPSTQDQIKDILRTAFYAGMEARKRDPGKTAAEKQKGPN